MNHQPVKSSNIASVGFEDGTLEVKFHSGKTYSYHGVDDATHAAFLKARSKGKFLGQHIKGKYPYKEKEKK